MPLNNQLQFNNSILNNYINLSLSKCVAMAVWLKSGFSLTVFSALCLGVIGFNLGQPVLAAQGQELWLQERLFASQAARRSDLIADARQRLTMVAPENPEIIVLDFQDALAQQNNYEQRRLLELAQASGNKALPTRLAALERLTQSSGQTTLQQARLFIAAGQYEVGVKKYESLFGKHPPTFELALEYWEAVSSVQPRRPEAMAQLAQLNKNYPDNSQLQLFIARLYFSEDRPKQALQVLHQMQGASEYDSQRAAELEYDYLIRLPVSHHAVGGLQDFLQRYPNSHFHPAAQRNVAAQKKLLANKNWRAGQRGRHLVEQEHYAEAEPILYQAIINYPADYNLEGSLGQALIGLERYEEAEQHFALAISKAGRILNDNSVDKDVLIVDSVVSSWLAKWESLHLYSQSLILIKNGDTFQQEGNYIAARNSFIKAQKLKSDEVMSYLRLYELELELGKEAAALNWLQKAQAAQPHDYRVIYATLGYYRERDPEQMRLFIAKLPALIRVDFADLEARLAQDELAPAIEQALAKGDTEQAIELQRRSLAYTPNDPWQTYKLASMLLNAGYLNAADKVFIQLVQTAGQEPEVRYAHSIYLINQDRDTEALNTLTAIETSLWTDDMQALHERLQRRQRSKAAEQLFLAGYLAQALDLLLQDAGAEQHSEAASWYQESGQNQLAVKHYQQALELEPNNQLALVGLAEVYVAEGKGQQAKTLLHQFEIDSQTSPYLIRRAAEVYAAVGDTPKALELYELLLVQTGEDAQNHRNVARLHSKDEPELALNYYARGLVANNLLARQHLTPLDFSALTAATRMRKEDDWLARSLKSDTEALYRQRNTSIQLQQDFGWRGDSSAKGLSKLKRHTTILRIDTPIAKGTGFMQAEHVRLNTKKPSGNLFGLCSKVHESCNPDKQNASGTGIAFGWEGDHWEVDLGHSPFGFQEKNWLGGLAYNNSWQSLNYNLGVSRRPISNTVLSYAGAEDPVTNTKWGGVTATGLTFGLSYDEGGEGGVWTSFGVHSLKGNKVYDNQRFTAMAGYYHRLIEEVDERMRLGITAMHWQYDKGMDEFTLGQGGYYSPQNYFSLGMPFSYAWRNYDWSVAFDAVLSVSRAAYDGGDKLYLNSSDDLISKFGYTKDDNAALNNIKTPSKGKGVRARLMGERRLTDHLAVGAGFNWGYSKNYSPSHAFMYLRYVIKPWRGNLMLPIEPLTPYADWK